MIVRIRIRIIVYIAVAAGAGVCRIALILTGGRRNRLGVAVRMCRLHLRTAAVALAVSVLILMSRLGNDLLIHIRAILILFQLGVNRLAPVIDPLCLDLLGDLRLRGLHILDSIRQHLGRARSGIAIMAGILRRHVNLALALDLVGDIHHLILYIRLYISRNILRSRVAARSLHGNRTFARLHGFYVNNTVLVAVGIILCLFRGIRYGHLKRGSGDNLAVSLIDNLHLQVLIDGSSLQNDGNLLLVHRSHLGIVSIQTGQLRHIGLIHRKPDYAGLRFPLRLQIRYGRNHSFRDLVSGTAAAKQGHCQKHREQQGSHSFSFHFLTPHPVFPAYFHISEFCGCLTVIFPRSIAFFSRVFNQFSKKS